MKVVRTPQSVADVDNLARYIALDSVDNALRTLDRIDAALERLADLPDIGRAGEFAGTRELTVTRTPYIVIYRVGRLAIEVLRIVHGAQDSSSRKP